MRKILFSFQLLLYLCCLYFCHEFKALVKETRKKEETVDKDGHGEYHAYEETIRVEILLLGEPVPVQCRYLVEIL